MIQGDTGRGNEENDERGNENAGDLDVVLKSLWEGEEEIVSRNKLSSSELNSILSFAGLSSHFLLSRWPADNFCIPRCLFFQWKF